MNIPCYELSKTLKKPFGGQKIFEVEEDTYQLSSGEVIDLDTINNLIDRGLCFKINSFNLDENNISVVIPEKVNVFDKNASIYSVGSQLCRVSPIPDLPYAGDLIFKSNIEGYFISENGYIIDSLKLKILHNRNELIRNDYVMGKKEIHKPEVDLTKKEAAFSAAIRKQHFFILFGIIIASLVLIFGLPYIESQISIMAEEEAAAGISVFNHDAQKEMVNSEKKILNKSVDILK